MGEWSAAPEDSPTDETSASMRLVVDGEQFDVRERPGRPGEYEFTWVSGPNPGYGFTSSGSDGRPQTASQLEDDIRTFLAQVDPKTGFIE